MRSGFLVFPLAAVLLVAGCSSGGQSPDPTPSVPPVTSPAATATPTPSATSSEDALYAEAERVYRAALEAQWKFELTGDYSEFPPELAEYYSPDYLDATRSAFDRAAQTGTHMTGGTPIVTTGPAPGRSLGDSVAAIEACYDARELTIVNGQGEIQRQGTLIHVFAFFEVHDDKLKMFNLEGEEVTECSIA